MNTVLKLPEKPPERTLGGGGRPPVIRFPRYGGDGGGGRDDGYPNFGERLRRYRLGLMVGLVAVGMLFVSFTSVYMVRENFGAWDAATNTYVRDWKPLKLPLGLLFMNTGLLLASSFTIEKARRAALQQAAVAPITALPGIADDRPSAPWLPITVVLGCGFVFGQLMAWRVLARRGFYLATSPSSSFFYVLTGMHALHLLGGILALVYASATLLRRSRRRLEHRRIVVDVTAWYWHFMALLWIYIFALLKLTG